MTSVSHATIAMWLRENPKVGIAGSTQRVNTGETPVPRAVGN
jgi:hypothetical protein